ncbi:MAG: DUF167 domain-containing protein [Candidatus Thermoplasmatota archaeon]|jgi:uncharacterized protein YggU (UPF0235/DUF167 family)|nr:DUF167 domain-containing protein [Candidatus Thermoplasmatota archaeon]MCL5788908.1 DUF167 domain-containing protein [Candidatus Thermoplasmatota archaeon]
MLKEGQEVRVEVIVKRGKDKVEEKEGIIVIHTTEKRKNDRANMDIIRQLSRFYSVPQANIRIVSGRSSPKKLVDIQQ